MMEISFTIFLYFILTKLLFKKVSYKIKLQPSCGLMNESKLASTLSLWALVGDWAPSYMSFIY